MKQNKGSILKASVDYIRQLQTELQKTKEIEDKLRQSTLMNRKLCARIKVNVNLKFFFCLKFLFYILCFQELEMQCKYQDIMSSTFAVQPQASMTTTQTTNTTVQQQQQLTNTQQLINTNLDNTSNSEIIFQQISTPPVKQEPIMIDYSGLNQTLLTFPPQHQVQHIQQQQQQQQPNQHLQQHYQGYYQPFNDSGLSMHNFNTFDDHMMSPIKQNDPLLSNCTIYDESLIDSLN